jgi:hypothetical protein
MERKPPGNFFVGAIGAASPSSAHIAEATTAEGVSDHRDDLFNRRLPEAVDSDADGAINDPLDGDKETKFLHGGRVSWQLREQ